MSECGKSGGKSHVKSKPRASRGCLQFPIAQIHRLLRRGHYAERVGAATPIYVSIVLDYLTTEILADNDRDNWEQDHHRHHHHHHHGQPPPPTSRHPHLRSGKHAADRDNSFQARS
ncbi:histone H2AX-like [Callorhinchus milii]|uniref:histone H2AX-like n=1 Tax=Callorhinchus milii TaxID=7868 RepID=UPI000457305A|nr:histone H2AX-like [Callorhinchus milii]|eukprot:gi/632988190/ref/XP_007882971.1/ PREDICTED: histone H2AX-like [Callorhinchus milii]